MINILIAPLKLTSLHPQRKYSLIASYNFQHKPPTSWTISWDKELSDCERQTLMSITCSWYLISKSRLEGRGCRSWLWPCQNTGNIVSALPSPLLTLLHHFEVWLGRISSEGETNTGLVPSSITNLDITKTLIFQTCWEPHKTFCLSSQSLLIIIAKLVQHNTFSSKGHNYF